MTIIGPYAFRGCSGLRDITIGNSLTDIGYEAFNGCHSAHSLIYAEGTKVVLGTGLTNIQNVTLPKTATSIEAAAFKGCEYLTNIIIPNSVISIGDKAFRDCKSLNSVTIGNSVTNIGSGAFAGCKAVESLIYADGTTRVLETGIYSIKKVTIPNSVTSIGMGAFSDCSNLASIEIPNSVISIEFGALIRCTSLRSIKVNWSQPLNVQSELFDDINKSICVLYVPKGSLELYQSAEVWKEFLHIVEFNPPAAINGIMADSPIKDDVFYDLQGRKVTSPAHGIFIHNGKKVYVK